MSCLRALLTVQRPARSSRSTSCVVQPRSIRAESLDPREAPAQAQDLRDLAALRQPKRNVCRTGDRERAHSLSHNMYKEFRELSRADAVHALYQDMAARHRARFRSIQVRPVTLVDVLTR